MQSINNDNNFDLLRILAAVFVFWSHSYHIYGYNEYGLIQAESYRDITMGTLGVNIFFSISGFLIAACWLRTKNVIEY